jgi:leukotriene-A4 hydrolase
MKALKPTNKVVLDSQGLNISAVELVKEGAASTPLKFELSTPKPEIGSKLLVNLDPALAANSQF